MAYFKCGGSSGATILHGSTDPISDVGANGQIYLKTSPYGEDLSDMGTKVENPSVMTISKSRNQVDFTYASGSALGAQAYKQFDLTDIDELKITLTVGNKAYQSNFTAWHPKVYITDSDPSASFITSTLVTELATSGETQEMTVDVSSYTGNQYIVFISSGCNGSFSGLKLDGVTYDIITGTKLKVNGSWADLIGSDLNDVNL